MRTAQEWGLRPLSILRGEPRGGWDRLDAILATAHTLSKDLICSGCGQPKFEAWNPDAEGFYEVKTEVCWGCYELERDAKSRKDDEYRPEEKTWVVETDDHPHGKLHPHIPGHN